MHTDPATIHGRRIRHLAVALVAVFVAGCGDSGDSGAADTGDDRDLLADVVTVEIDDRSHLDGTIEYDDEPPLGGPHNAAWVNCGRYDEPVPNELAVHALEHGAVWLTHPPDLADTELERLDDLAATQTHVLVSPLPDTETLTATAWGVQLELDGADDPALDVFVETYLQGPQTPEPGAPCTGGAGQPVT